MIRRAAIIGVGLMGGSLGAVLKRDGLAERVVGCGRGKANLDLALERGLIDSAVHNPVAAVENADLVVVCVPVAATEAIFATIAPALPPEAVVTDVGSTKGQIVALAEHLLPRPSRFVGGHPIAGTEESGAGAAVADLFQDARWILTPTEATDADAVDLVATVAGSAGAQVEQLTPAEHDRIFGWVSHLPHLLAFGLGAALERENPAWFGYGGGGLRDFLRVAASDPVMWRDIFAANGAAVAAAYAVFREEVESLLALAENPDELEARLQRIREDIRRFRAGRNSVPEGG